MRERRALIVVDMSVEQYANISYKRREIVESIRSLSKLDWTLKIDSRLWLGSPEESTLSLAFPEWGRTMGIPGSEGAGLCRELDGLDLNFVEKKHYSSFVDTNLLQLLQKAEIDKVYVTGINTDYCVFLTAMDSQARGRFSTFVIEDAVSSVTGKVGHVEGIRRTKAHLGNKAVVHSKTMFPCLNS